MLPCRFPVPIRCIAGHFKWQKYERLQWPTIVFLRNPVDRLVSQFSIGANRERTTFEKYVQQARNSMTGMVGSLDRYLFVGLQEHFTESMRMLEWYTGISFTWPLLYRNHHKRPKIEIDLIDRCRIIANSDLDLVLYREALKRFCTQRREYREATQT